MAVAACLAVPAAPNTGWALVGALGACALAVASPTPGLRRRVPYLACAGAFGLWLGASGHALIDGLLWGAVAGLWLGMALSQKRYGWADALWLIPVAGYAGLVHATRLDTVQAPLLIAVAAAHAAWLLLHKTDRGALFTAAVSSAGFGLASLVGGFVPSGFDMQLGLPPGTLARGGWGLIAGGAWGVAAYTLEEARRPLPPMRSPGAAALAWLAAAWFIPFATLLEAAGQVSVLRGAAVVLVGCLGLAGAAGCASARTAASSPPRLAWALTGWLGAACVAAAFMAR